MLKKIKSFCVKFLMFLSKNNGHSIAGHKEGWPKTQSDYEEFWGSDEAMEYYFEPGRLKFYDDVLKFIPISCKKILDVGCGNGFFLSRIAKLQGNQGEDMTGVDYAESGFIEGRKLLPRAKFIKAPAEKLPFEDNSFDVVIMMETLEHLEKWKEALDEAYRVLSVGGCFIVTAPDGEIDNWAGHTNFWSELDFKKNLSPYGVSLIKKIDEGRTFIAIIEK